MTSKPNKSMTRREFIKATGKVTAGVAVGTSSLGILGKSAYAARKKDVMILGGTQEPVQFNPLFYNNPPFEAVPEACCFDALWDINEKGEFIPNLAVRVPTVKNGGISDDGLSWRIELKQGVRWHDGRPFTARDVNFTYKTIINPDLPVRTRAGFDLIEDFKVLDDYNIEMRLSKLYMPFMWSWQTIHILPEHILSQVENINTAAFNTNPMGTGPFLFHKRVAGSHIIYKKNPNYHGHVPALETFIQKVVPDQNVLYTQFKTGEIDVLSLHGVPAERYDEALKLPNRDVLPTPGPWNEFIYFNCGKPQFTDPRVRKALYMAIDKDRWIKDIWYGTQTRALTYLPAGHWAVNSDVKDPGFDPGSAAQLLDAAGWRVGADGIRQKNGVKLKFSMSTSSGSKAREQAQVLVQQNWKDINVSMEIRNMPASVVWGEYTTKSEFDTLMVAWGLIMGMDPDYTDRCHSKLIPAKTGKGSNYVQYENAKVDRLLEEGVVTPGRASRIEIYKEIQKILDEEVPFAPIFTWNNLYGKKSSVKGYKVNGYVKDQTWNVQDWYWG